MSSSPRRQVVPGPCRASQIRDGEPYELSNGQRIECMSSGRRHGLGHFIGAMPIGTDPAAQATAIDLGLEWGEAKHLRAPDIAVGDFANEPGWEPGVPPLVVEYADRGQDEAGLREKISELLNRGVRYLWVVRLVGPLRVEVHEPGKPMQVIGESGVLTAPEVLANPVPVRALVDKTMALEVTLRNLLHRKGYQSLDHVRAEGEAKGRAEGEAKGQAAAVLAVLAARGFTISASVSARVLSTKDLTVLNRWLLRAVTVADLADFFAE